MGWGGRRSFWQVLPAGCFLLALSSAAYADSLKTVLGQVYLNNPAIAAERAKLRSVDEQVPEALSNWRPNITAQGDAGLSYQVYDTTSGALKPADASISATQPIFRGGRTIAATHQADAAVQQERAQLVATEQSVFVDATTAYLDLLQDQTILDLQLANEKTLQDWVSEASARFKDGEKSRTDISLFQSRLARAQADRKTAEINLAVARSTYTRFFGQSPGALAPPDLDLKLPGAHDVIIDEATRNAPDVLAAYYDVRAQDANVDLVRGNLLPELNLVGSSANSWNENVPEQFVHDNKTVNDEVLLQLKVPLYTGGGDYARLREAYQQRGQKRLTLDEAKREAVDKAEQAWDQFNAEEEVIIVRKNEIVAAEETVKGMKIEERVGDRSSFDTLDAEQDLLNAQVSSAQAEHDHTIAFIHLLAAIGQFTAEDLHLNIALYDPKKHYDESRGRWFGVGDANKE